MILSHPLAAQIFRGTVTDAATGRPLEGAVVALVSSQQVDTARSVRTNNEGEYVLNVGAIGSFAARASLIGYQSAKSESTVLQGGDVVTLDFALSAVSITLSHVVVTGRQRLTRDELMSLVGFDLRRSRGVGLFLDSAHLMQFKRTPVAHVLEDHGTVPRILFLDRDSRGRALPFARIEMSKGSSTCQPRIFVDGWLINPTPESMRFAAIRLSTLGADQIHGVEVYNLATLPPASVGGEIGDWAGKPRAEQCGALVVWTKAFANSRSRHEH